MFFFARLILVDLDPDLTSLSLPLSLLALNKPVAFLYAWLASLCDDGGTGIDACCFGCCDGSGSELCGDCCGADCFCC